MNLRLCSGSTNKHIFKTQIKTKWPLLKIQTKPRVVSVCGGVAGFSENAIMKGGRRRKKEPKASQDTGGKSIELPSCRTGKLKVFTEQGG